MKSVRHFLTTLFCAAALCGVAHGQEMIVSTDPPIVAARALVDAKDYSAARAAYEKLFEAQPTDAAVCTEYLDLLINRFKDYKAATRVAEKAARAAPSAPAPLVHLGRIQAEQGRDKQATEYFENAIALLTGDDLLTTSLAVVFSFVGRTDYAIKTYERAREILRAPFLYTGPLSRLYAQTGDFEKAVNALLDGGPAQVGGIEETKASLLDILGTDEKKQQAASKALVKRINAQPENFYLAELLTWLYTQRGDWEGALIQIQALDERGKEGGRRLIQFARLAAREKQYDVAVKSLDAILEKGKEYPAYASARAEKLGVLTTKLRENPAFEKAEVATLQKEYETAFTDAPSLYATDAARDWATVEAQYADNPHKGIQILEKALKEPGLRRDLAGSLKLQLGDYQVLVGKVWDASLLYSQVDKDFREDALGEEARFRNGKLAYYRGDFDWAQGQLSVLKASTSELIANDALYLSVLMTENIPPDSNLVPLRRYAAADLLLFQNKDSAASLLLDSVANAFPKHPLQDDILMLRARLAEKHRDYMEALALLNTVVEKHGQDVLGDDAVFKIAELYETRIKDLAKAREHYEKLIIEYPGSTYVQIARGRLSAMAAPAGS